MKQMLWGKPCEIKVDGQPVCEIGELNHPIDDALNKAKDWREQTYEMQCEVSEDTRKQMLYLMYGNRIERLVARMRQFYKPFKKRNE